jgi:excinuclease UvrABC helicase subunit UvrB
MLFNHFNRFFRDLESLDELFNEFVPKNQKTQTGTDDKGEWERKTYVSDNGLYSYSYFTRKNKTNTNVDEVTKLKYELDECVENQDFETAVELRDKIKKLEENKQEIDELNNQLNECVKNQDFEKAIKLRDKIKKLK